MAYREMGLPRISLPGTGKWFERHYCHRRRKVALIALKSRRNEFGRGDIMLMVNWETGLPQNYPSTGKWIERRMPSQVEGITP